MKEETFLTLTDEVSDETILPVLKLLLNYLAKTQMRSLDHLQIAEQYDTSHYLVFTQEVRRNLELTTSLRDGSRNGTLLWVLDQTKTAMGEIGRASCRERGEVRARAGGVERR